MTQRPSRTTLLVLALAWAAWPRLEATTVYVDVSQSTGSHDGSSWANAYSNLVNALSSTGSGSNLWVAAGTYTPSGIASNSFEMQQGVNLYGGFTNGMASFGSRDWVTHRTILDGSSAFYHVIQSRYSPAIDGFTVRNGNANGPQARDKDGGGVFVYWGYPTVTNCTFAGNSATDQGGAIYNQDGNPFVSKCRFETNSAALGGALAGPSSCMIDNCVFLGNSAIVSGGALYTRDFAACPVVKNSTFIDNRCANGGGAIRLYQVASPTIENCTFSTNYAGDNGGGISISEAYIATVEDCTFSGNAIGSDGGGLVIGAVSGRVENCVFSGNASQYGAMNWRCNTGVVKHCLFIGNTGWGRAGGVYSGYDPDSHVTVENCTFFRNRAQKGGGICKHGGGLTVRNCVFRGNVATSGAGSGHQIWIESGGQTISYTAIEGGVSGIVSANMVDGGGNTTNNPQFAGVTAAGTWSSAGSYGPGAGQTVLTDTGSTWTEGALTGMTVNPDTGQYLHFLVSTNSATTITVWGNASSLAQGGTAYEIHDVHLKSRYGRWTAEGWHADAAQSPCVDAGDPGAGHSLEPEPNGNRANMGAYGNTDQASKTPPIGPVFITR